MKCSCGTVFLTTAGHTRCWECRLIGDPPRKRSADAAVGLPALTSWSGWATGIGTTS